MQIEDDTRNCLCMRSKVLSELLARYSLIIHLVFKSTQERLSIFHTKDEFIWMCVWNNPCKKIYGFKKTYCLYKSIIIHIHFKVLQIFETCFYINIYKIYRKIISKTQFKLAKLSHKSAQKMSQYYIASICRIKKLNTVSRNRSSVEYWKILMRRSITLK